MSAIDNVVSPFAGRHGTADALALALVWVTFAVSCFVFSEPAPYDVLMMGLVLALPLLRLTTFTLSLVVFFLLWVVVLVGAALSTTQSLFLDRAIPHALVTAYLALSTTVIAAFIVQRPEAHTRLILSAYVLAGLLAATAGVIGYFDLLPPFHDTLVERQRARGTFKDPNVLGAFLVPIIIWLVHRILHAEPRRLPAIGAMLVYLAFGLLLSFSRGAWFNMIVAFLTYGLFSFVTSRSHRHRTKLIVLALLGALTTALLIVVALNWNATADLLRERATLEQDYDIGREGRFAGQAKAIGVIAEHPLGIGALGYAPTYHHENAHNVYLTAFLDYGWIGGFGFLAVVGATLFLGLRNMFRASPLQGMSIVAFASFAGMTAEGLVVDTYHWRFFFLVVAMIWAFHAATRGRRRVAAVRTGPLRPRFDPPATIAVRTGSGRRAAPSR